MSAILAYAIALLLNLGAISPDSVNSASSNYQVVQKDGKTVLVDTIGGTEIIIAM